jgi:hypothetical protein
MGLLGGIFAALPVRTKGKKESQQVKKTMAPAGREAKCVWASVSGKVTVLESSEQ